MKRAITKINDLDFDAEVLFPRKAAAVFFSAYWNADDREARVVFETTAEKFCSRTAFYEFDVDENPIIPTAYGIRRVPAILTFADGRLTEAHSGFITEEKLSEKIERLADSGEFYQTVAAFSRKMAARLGAGVEMLRSQIF